MLAKLLIDTDGNKPLLEYGVFGVDGFSTDTNNGRIYARSNGVNRPLAFQDEAAANRYGTTDEIYDITTLYPGELIYNITTEEFVYYKESTGKWIYLLSGTTLSRIGYGDGPVGTWIESWETTTTEPSNWESDEWGGFVEGAVDGKWNIRSTATDTNGTGPDLAYDGTYFLYAETSNGGHDETFRLSTTYFNKLSSVDLWINMSGKDMGTFNIITIADGNSNVAYTISGDQGTAWINVVLDLSLTDADTLVFEYLDAEGYKGDFAIDKISITST